MDITPADLIIEIQALLLVRYQHAGIIIERIETRRATLLLLRILILLDSEMRS